MPSPFPGMDPWLESHWGDIHHRLVNYACDAIQEQLPADLFARMEERVYVETPQELMARIPDVRVVERPALPEIAVSPATDSVAVAEPYVLEICTDPVTEGFIEIREAGGDEQVVTVIEVLSPTNKTAGEGRRQYQRKQSEVQQAGVNLVEIDLLRSGQWSVLAVENALPERLRSPYRISVWRFWQPLSIEFYHAPLRERLPAIRLPLRHSDSDVVLDLQAMIDRCYRMGRYEATDYTADAVPPLNESDAAWAGELLHDRNSV